MKPFTQSGAIHFVSSFGANVAVAGDSVNDFVLRTASGTTYFDEGTQKFNGLRDCLLRESERSLLMANTCYVRALEGLRDSSAYWSVVGLYYASFFSAKAILGIHGCWFDRPKSWIEVVDSNPASQRIAYRVSKYQNNAGLTGSHQIFWAAFYEAMNHLSGWLVSPAAILAINPVNANVTWLIDTRNEINYEPLAAFEMMNAFQANFNPALVPSCFGGKLQTMLQVSQAFVLFSKEMAVSHGLITDVWAPSLNRRDWTRQYVTSSQHAAIAAFAASERPQLEY